MTRTVGRSSAPGDDRPRIRARRRPPAARSARLSLAVLVLLTGVTLLLGLRQQGPLHRPRVRRGRAAAGRTTSCAVDHDVCYSDIQYLWLGRDIDQHVFPYLHGSITAGRASWSAARSSTRC